MGREAENQRCTGLGLYHSFQDTCVRRALLGLAQEGCVHKPYSRREFLEPPTDNAFGQIRLRQEPLLV